MLIDKLVGFPPAALGVPYPYPGMKLTDVEGALFAAVIEYALGKVSAASVIATFELTPVEQTDALALVAAMQNGNAVLVGSTPLERIVEVQNVLLLARSRCPPYVDEAAVRARLGI